MSIISFDGSVKIIKMPDVIDPMKTSAAAGSD